MTRYEDMNRELFDEDGVINKHVAVMMFKHEDIIIKVLESLDEESFERAELAFDKVKEQKK
ncbi:hypothetical protein ACW5XW_23925 [Aeromonas piscicola]|uniref:hypothetical protein n=1 Tax=Aeromonas TaxID=642 RepID=UPI0012E056D9|nr:MULTISPECIES: hypothetical protein [Aeromonas]MDM5128643.1 hypothetical protein [Aeromonas salmonicida]HDN9017658.1 hypothetical protein [Aeromonas salmonicida]